MPTLEHQGLIDLFRENPSLGPHFLSLVFHLDVPAHASVRVVDGALDQLIPIEFRADLVLELRDADDAVVLAIVFEVQRARDPRKKFSWPVYLAATRSERGCPAILMIVATDADVAAWAAEPIDLGLGLAAVQPLVLGPATLPVVTDPAVAEREVELALLSVMAHGNGPDGLAVLKAAFDAIHQLDPEHWAVYFQMMWGVLRAPLRSTLEALVMERQVESKRELPPFMMKIMADSKLEGEIAGELRGERKGKLEAGRSTLLRLTKRAGIALTDDDRARIQACDDAATLERWAENVIGAKTAADVLA